MLLLLEIPLKRQKQTRYGSEDIIGSGCVRACELERERQRAIQADSVLGMDSDAGLYPAP